MDELDDGGSTAGMSELEKKALERKKRLAQMKEQLDSVGEDGEPQRKEGPMIFRSYKPVDQQTFDQLTHGVGQLSAVERAVGKHLEDTMETTVNDKLDIGTLAPRKVDWDLRRGIQPKLDKLERRTQNAIVQLIRQRLEQEGGTKEGGLLAGAVNAIAEANEEDD